MQKITKQSQIDESLKNQVFRVRMGGRSADQIAKILSMPVRLVHDVLQGRI